MAANYFNVTRANVGNQKPGLSHVGYIAPLSWFDDLEQPAGGGGAGDVTISTDHTFLSSPTGLGFLKLYMLPKSGEETGETNGDPGALASVWKGKFIIPGDTPELQNLIENHLKNDDVIVLYLDANDASGAVYQHGSRRAPANIISVNKTSGVKGSGTKGWTLEIEAVDRYFYEGVITEYSGSI